MSFPICMIVVMVSGKCDVHIHFTFLQEFWTPHIRKYFYIFFALYMTRFPTFNFQLSIMSKCLAKRINTKVSFKITVRKRYVTLTLVELQYETSVSIWEFEMMIVLNWMFCLHFSSLHDYIHRTKMKLCLLMNSDTLVCLWLLVFPIGKIVVSTSCKCCFLLYFISLHDYWTPSTWNSLVHTLWVEMERCENRTFQLLEIRKRKSAET